MIKSNSENGTIELNSPTALPKASGFLWNKKMMINMNCRGYANSQFMHPEPAKYSHAPNLEAKTFMQPEQPYYAHHPGRFFYIKDEESHSLFSAPYEPCRTELDKFQFSVAKSNITWTVQKDGISVEIILTLTEDDFLELWELKITNTSGKPRSLSIYPYFSVGYMSWMNQSANFVEELNSIICSSISPYQKYQDYPKIKELKDKTILMAEKLPDAWETNQEIFEGEGGLHYPSAIKKERLSNSNSNYELPTSVMQFRTHINNEESIGLRFIFGPAKDENEILNIKEKYFPKNTHNNFETAKENYKRYIEKGAGIISIKTPDETFNNFINHWLPRQIYYHGETNRLCTDPQTRNFLQDQMGMSYISPGETKKSFLLALSQQSLSGEMPDGILLNADAELKYINQVPHTDHCIWLPVCLDAYLNETSDYEILNEKIPFADSNDKLTVTEHIDRAILWLTNNRDDRGLNYINQGDWCDPMNMVGPKGKGVSGWLSIATIYALEIWIKIKNKSGHSKLVDHFSGIIEELKFSVNKYLWDGEWFARGISDNNKIFGVSDDSEGKIFLTPQAWALLTNKFSNEQKNNIVKSVKTFLETPYGIEMLSPPFTKMNEEIGRVTQKFPGSAENGSVYNHAAAFFIFGLYNQDEEDYGYSLLRKMIPGPNIEDLKPRGQLQNFIPNYYRGAYNQIPSTAGRSSQLFNTGTVHWYYRIVIEKLFGLEGTKEGLSIDPKLPSEWNEVKVARKFRGAIFNVVISRTPGISNVLVVLNNITLNTPIIRNIKSGESYSVEVRIP